MPRTKTVTTYLCNVCNAEYATLDEALECESKPTTPFLFNDGETVTVIAQGDILERGKTYQARITKRGHRRANGKHFNSYAIRYLNTGYVGDGIGSSRSEKDLLKLNPRK